MAESIHRPPFGVADELVAQIRAGADGAFFTPGTREMTQPV